MNTLLHFFFPFVLWFDRVNATSLKADFMAGITGAVIVLPQGVAFATIAGSAAAIAPAGLGVSEILSAALAPIVSVGPATAFLAVALNRIIGLSVTALSVLATGGFTKAKAGGKVVG